MHSDPGRLGVCTNQRALHAMLLPNFSEFCDLDFLQKIPEF